MNERITKLNSKARGLPTSSGCYIMRAASGEIIYIGKAKNLRSRVGSYFDATEKNIKTATLVSKIVDFDYILTPTESDSLALECNLIKKHSPFYNIMLKDGKAYPYIKLNLKNKYPKLEITRKLKTDGSKYFGPFLRGGVKWIFDLCQQNFRLVSCGLKLGEKRYKRPCLKCDLGVCLAPCVNLGNDAMYKEEVDKVIKFLSGDYKDIQKILISKMKNLAEDEKFEDAMKVKEDLDKLKMLSEKRIVVLNNEENADAFAAIENETHICICMLCIRSGKLDDAQCFTFKKMTEENELSSFVLSFYKDNGINVSKILMENVLNEESASLEKCLADLKGTKVQVVVPLKGRMQNIIQMAKNNAAEFLIKNREQTARKEKLTTEAMIELQERLGLKTLPKRIECFDISNTFGTNSVASMVVFKNGEPAKQLYRKFKIKTVVGANDFASHQEVFLRRLNELRLQADLSFKETPNLIIIDGGVGQVSSVIAVLTEFKKSLTKEALSNFDFDLIGLAERNEEVFIPYSNHPIILDKGSFSLRLLERARDEAHRFAISYHRSVRDKKMFK